MHRIPFWLLTGVTFFGTCHSLEAQAATTYHVSPDGNDDADGSVAAPWANPQRCVVAESPLVAGDTCLVHDGVYTVPPSNKGRVIVVSSSAPSATPNSPITIKSQNPRGAILRLPSSWPGVDCNEENCPYAGANISKANYTIEGFEIDGADGGDNKSKSSIAGIVFYAAGVARDNWIHNIGTDICSNSVFGFSGVFTVATDVVIERNVIHTVGRLRDGEKGCSTVLFQNDHGIYVSIANNTRIRRNVIYDTNRGFPINFYRSGGGTTFQQRDLLIEHNTFAGRSPTAKPSGQIIYGGSIDGFTVRNNIFYDPQGAPFSTFNTGSLAKVSIQNNLTNSADPDYYVSAVPVGAAIGSGNIVGANPNFSNVGGNDFTLLVGSPALDAGISTGAPFCGSAPDIGAIESCADDSIPAAPLGLQVY